MVSSVVAELEGTIVKDPDPFAYFMLVAFEASGPIRFAILLMFWPVIRLLEVFGKRDAGLRLTIFVAVTGLRMSNIEYVGRAVLPKFYMGDLDTGAWRAFSQYGKRVVVTKTPRVMVERFVKDHLRADQVTGTELVVNRFGYATGMVKEVGPLPDRVANFIGDHQPSFVLGRSTHIDFTPLISQCKMRKLSGAYLSSDSSPWPSARKTSSEEEQEIIQQPVPVIFHDGRLAKKPKPCIAFFIVLYFPIGVVLGICRLIYIFIVPMCVIPLETLLAGTYVKVKGNVPASHSQSRANGGILFVCNHRTLADPIILSHVVKRKTPVVTYSISWLAEIMAPVRTIRLTRDRNVDAAKIKSELEKGDLVICPEGTTCREPYLLRFSALFAELTDHIVPVAINYNPLLFYATTVRGWKALDMLFGLMNPIIIYEMTFLDKLEAHVGRKSPHEVADQVQALLAHTLGFTCTKFTRKDKYSILS